MKPSRHAWTRAEKLLFFAPFVLGVALGGTWLAQRTAPISIAAGESTSIAFSPDGRRLAVLTRGARKSFNAGAIFDAHTGHLQARLQVPNPDASLGLPSWAPDSARFATGYTDFTKGTLTYKKNGKTRFNSLYYVAIWDASSGAESRFFPYADAQEDAYASLLWARNGQLWGRGTPPALFDVQSGKRLRRFGPPTVPGGREFNSFNANYKLLAIERKDEGSVEIYEIPGGRLVRKLRFPNLVAALWSEDAEVLAIFQKDRLVQGRFWSGTMRLLNARTGRALATPPLTHGEDWAWADNQQIVLVDRPIRSGAAGETSRVLLWDFRAAKMLWQKTSGPQNEKFSSLSVSRDGRRLSVRISTASTSRAVWDLKTGKEIWRQPIDARQTYSRWAPDSKRLAIYGDNGVQIHRIPD